jgi:hypothetical protein
MTGIPGWIVYREHALNREDTGIKETEALENQTGFLKINEFFDTRCHNVIGFPVEG